MRLGRPPPYPRLEFARACLVTQSSARLVPRRHCLYKVCPKSDTAAVWVRPTSPEALAYMQAQGCDAQRHLCSLAGVEALIAALELRIEDAAPRPEE